MSELANARRMLEAAERAAVGGDLASADELLRGAARIQEAELGPQHPELATTLTNLAIVAERQGWPGDAESFYRRAASIATASLPADHPIVVASRQNLEDFCRAGGLPIDVPEPNAADATDAAGAKPEPTATTADAMADARASDAADATQAAEAADATDGTDATDGADGTDGRARTTPPVDWAATPLADRPVPRASRRSSGALWLGLAILALAAIAVFMQWGTLPAENMTGVDGVPTASSSAPTPAPEPPAAREAPVTPPPAAAPTPAAPAPAAPPSTADPDASVPAPPPSAGSAGETDDRSADAPADSPALAAVALCRTLGTAGAEWRCDEAADSVAAGPLTFYTRVRSPRDTVVFHRWYRGDRLQQSVRLRIGANPSAGYRTYSRLSVNGDGPWRVEIVDADGAVLAERRFTVR